MALNYNNKYKLIMVSSDKLDDKYNIFKLSSPLDIKRKEADIHI